MLSFYTKKWKEIQPVVITWVIKMFFPRTINKKWMCWSQPRYKRLSINKTFMNLITDRPDV